jgi:hypothetical protein
LLDARRELLDTRRKLLTLTEANDFLKKTLGEMTVALAAKDRQIDSQRSAGCEEQQKARPSVPMSPGRNNVSERGAHCAGNELRIASAEGATK